MAALLMDDHDLPDKLPSDKPDIILLDASNYVPWRKAIRIFFNSKSLLPLVDNDPPVDADAKWHRLDRWCFSVLYFACSKEAQDNLEDTMSTRQAWSTLADLYHSATLGNIFRLSISFNALTQKPDQSALSFINQVVAAAHELRDLGEDLSDQKIKFQVLGHLRPEFDSLVTTLSTVDTDASPLSLKSIRDSILREETTIARKKGRDPVVLQPLTPQPVVYASASQTRQTRPSSGRKCPACGWGNHSIHDCWHLYPDRAPSWWRRPLPTGGDLADSHPSRTSDASRSFDSSENQRNSSENRRNSSENRRQYNSQAPPAPHGSRSRSRSDRYSAHASVEIDPSVKRKRSPRGSSSPDPCPKRHTSNIVIGLPCTPLDSPYIDHACMMQFAGSTAGSSSAWMLDSGASNHYTSNRASFITFEPTPPIPIETASSIIHGSGKGDIVLRLSCGTIRISDVIYVPSVLNVNLLSIGQLEAKGIEFTMKNGKCFVWKHGSLWAVASRTNNVYLLHELDLTGTHTAHSLVSFPALSSDKEPRRVDTQLFEIWHRRLGHLNRKYVSALKNLSDRMDFGPPHKHTIDCSDCLKANQRRQISRMPTRKPDSVLDIVHADICGPMQENDFWGHRYFLLLVCAKCRYKWTYLLFKKDDAMLQLRKWKAWAECQFSVRVKVLHTDGGGEFNSSASQEWYAAEGIEHVITPPYSPDMNGGCEVWNRVIVQTASAMLHTALLPLSFWGQAVLCATYLLNRSPTKGLQLKQTPFEALYHQKPYLGHIRIWGCRAYAHIPKEQKRKKWDSHCRECLLMGFYDSENVFKLYDINANSIIKVRDVVFFEDVLGHDKFRQHLLPLDRNILGELPPDGDHILDDLDDPYIEDVNPDPDHLATLHANWSYLLDAHSTSSLVTLTSMLALTLDGPPSMLNSPYLRIPRSYRSAMLLPEASHWKRACDLEFQALTNNNTWVLVPRTPDMSVIKNKQVFDVKLKNLIDSPSSPPIVERFRARLVARGDSQQKGINFDEVYAPVVRFVSLRIILHLAALHYLEIDHGDFCNAFLNGRLSDVQIFMEQPIGYSSNPNLVCLLRGAIYGLRQSARVWYHCLHQVLTDLGLHRINADQAIWILDLLILIAHVDDVLLIGIRTRVDEIKAGIARKYHFKDLGPVVKYTGIHILRDHKSRRLFLDQAPYVHEILDEFQMTNCTPSSLPMDPKPAASLSSVSDIPLDPDGVRLYQRAIGRLMYLMLGTRPDIAYAVTKLAQHASAPTTQNWTGVLKILRYLRTHDSVRLSLGNASPPFLVTPTPSTNLIGYFDASLMDCPKTRRSTGGYVFFLHGSCVSWCSKKQGLVALSSTEAEFIAGTEAAKELQWIINFLECFGLCERDPHLLGDNRGALALARNTDFKPRTKHIHARERYITQLVESGQLYVSYVPTKTMVADALTKALPREAFTRHASAMGLIFTTSRNVCNVCSTSFFSRNALHRHLRDEAHYCGTSVPSIAMLAADLFDA